LTSGNTTLSINPLNCITDFGDQKVTIKLEDEEPKSFTYDIIVKVANLPPEFSVNQLLDQALMINTTKNYLIPPFYDPEGCPVLVSFTT
jgi:hypothetical protein